MMEAESKKMASIRLSRMIQGVGEGRDVSDEEVIDQLLKTEERTSLIARWADAAVSFFLPRATPSVRGAKPTLSAQPDRPTEVAGS
jgi:hypothetical protein